jgi:hypothetical protein
VFHLVGDIVRCSLGREVFPAGFIIYRFLISGKTFDVISVNTPPQTANKSDRHSIFSLILQ